MKLNPLVATAAAAQVTAFDISNSVLDEVADDAERDIGFGDDGREVGALGSVALRLFQNDDANGKDTATLGLGLSYGFHDGVNGYDSTRSYVYQETDGVALTNDIHMIGSDFDTTLANHLAVSVAISNVLSLRTSYVIEYGGAELGDMERTPSIPGASVVHSFT